MYICIYVYTYIRIYINIYIKYLYIYMCVYVCALILPSPQTSAVRTKPVVYSPAKVWEGREEGYITYGRKEEWKEATKGGTNEEDAVILTADVSKLEEGRGVEGEEEEVHAPVPMASTFMTVK
jgi:hypothetical protein